MSRSCVPALPSTQPPPCMYKITGSVPSAPAGLTIRTRTSPTSAGTVIHCSSTGSLSIGAAWTSSSTLRASSGVISYRNGGLAVASTNACDAGSSTTGVYVVVAVMDAVLSVGLAHGHDGGLLGRRRCVRLGGRQALTGSAVSNRAPTRRLAQSSAWSATASQPGAPAVKCGRPANSSYSTSAFDL